MVDDPFDRLGRELEDAAARQVAAAAVEDVPQATRPPRRPRRSLGLFGAIVAVPVLAATAWAASALISTGSPVAYRDGVPVSGVGVGTAIPSTVKLLTTTVPDPDGGLPWGLRSFRTTRGLVCLQVGRVYEGKLGVLGRVGSFENDGRFHELRPGVVANEGQCFPPDGAGNAYLAFHFNGYLASGEPCQLAACLGTMMGRHPPGPPAPPLRQRRAVDFGLLGPKATSVTYRGDGGVKTMRTLGSDGGYLVVRRPLPDLPLPARYRHLASQGILVNGANEYIPSMSPVSRVIARVQYGSDGHCVVRPRTPFVNGSPYGGCPDPPGFVPIPPPRSTAVRTKVTARPVGTKEIRVRFEARVAIDDRLSAYSVTVYPERTLRRCRALRGHPKPAPGALCGLSTGDTTDRKIPAGRIIVKDVGLFRRPPGRYRVVVSLLSQPSHPSPGGLFGPPGTAETEVGRTTVTVR